MNRLNIIREFEAKFVAIFVSLLQLAGSSACQIVFAHPVLSFGLCSYWNDADHHTKEMNIIRNKDCACFHVVFDATLHVANPQNACTSRDHEIIPTK